jgi:hypothetical protein
MHKNFFKKMVQLYMVEFLFVLLKHTKINFFKKCFELE